MRAIDINGDECILTMLHRDATTLSQTGSCDVDQLPVTPSFGFPQSGGV